MGKKNLCTPKFWDKGFVVVNAPKYLNGFLVEQ